MNGARDTAAGTARILNVCSVKRQLEWMTLTVSAHCWWEVVDHPEAIMRGLDGWTFASCAASDSGDGTAVLTYYRQCMPRNNWHVVSTNS